MVVLLRCQSLNGLGGHLCTPLWFVHLVLVVGTEMGLQVKEMVCCDVGKWSGYLSGHVQGQEHTRCLGACGAPTYLQGVTQGEWIPAECLGRNVIVCKLGYVHGGLYLSRNEKKAVFSFCLSPAIYNRQVTWGKELNKERVVTHYCQ